MDSIEAFSKWFQALGPSTIMGLFFYVAGRWFNSSFWPWFQKLIERQTVAVEALITTTSKIDLQLTSALVNQAKFMDDVDQVRRDVEVIKDRLGIRPDEQYSQRNQSPPRQRQGR